MKVGFYKNDLSDPVDSCDSDAIEEVAKCFAEENHQIDEASDMDFIVYVEDNGGGIHKVKFYTEYDPRFEVQSVSKL